MHGLESLHDVLKAKQEFDEWEKKNIIALLKEERELPRPMGIPLPFLLLRARVNAHRNYEIYEFMSELSYDEVKAQFTERPQAMADAIRSVGSKIYSDRAETNKQVIV